MDGFLRCMGLSDWTLPHPCCFSALLPLPMCMQAAYVSYTAGSRPPTHYSPNPTNAPPALQTAYDFYTRNPPRFKLFKGRCVRSGFSG